MLIGRTQTPGFGKVQLIVYKNQEAKSNWNVLKPVLESNGCKVSEAKMDGWSSGWGEAVDITGPSADWEIKAAKSFNSKRNSEKETMFEAKYIPDENAEYSKTADEVIGEMGLRRDLFC